MYWQLIPPQMIGRVVSVQEGISIICHEQNISNDLCQKLVIMLPDDLKNAPCFFDRLTKLWRYEFGVPFDRLSGGGSVIGTHMFRPIDILCKILVAAQQFLRPDQLELFLSSLWDINKHFDYINEFAPIVRVSKGVDIEYEVTSNVVDGKSVDWRILVPAQPPIFLEAKTRVVDFVDHFSQMNLVGFGEESSSMQPTHDSSLLFRSTESKFLESSISEQIQGLWVHSMIRQEKSEFDRAFRALDSNKVHFVILGGFEDNAYVLAHSEVVKTLLIDVFHLQHSERDVFRRH